MNIILGWRSDALCSGLQHLPSRAAGPHRRRRGRPATRAGRLLRLRLPTTTPTPLPPAARARQRVTRRSPTASRLRPARPLPHATYTLLLPSTLPTNLTGRCQPVLPPRLLQHTFTIPHSHCRRVVWILHHRHSTSASCWFYNSAPDGAWHSAYVTGYPCLPRTALFHSYPIHLAAGLHDTAHRYALPHLIFATVADAYLQQDRCVTLAGATAAGRYRFAETHGGVPRAAALPHPTT